MLTKRIIPCLDIKNGRTVKGVNFENLKNAGDPVELGKYYSEQFADELVFLDITATNENRKTLYSLVEKIASEINIPFTVGGGISIIEDVDILLNSGADKVSVNSAAVRKPEFILEIAKKYGNQCVVVAVDAKFIDNEWFVFLNGGRIQTKLKLFDWVKQAENLGAGEILFTSMNHDGTKNGFANDALSKISEIVKIPVIASGGAGKSEHFFDTFTIGKSDAALAASIFHFKEIEIMELKKYLKNNGVNVRI